MKRITLLAAAIALAASVSFADNLVQKKQVLSKVYSIDRIYKSMEGPYEMQQIYLGDRKKPELVWVTSVRTDIMQEDGKHPANPEFMCHMNIDLDTAKHSAMLDLQRPSSTRLITLSQGVFEAKLPPGFGFPIISSEPLRVFTQVLNHNVPHPHNLKVRHLVTIEYIRDRDLKTPIKAVFPAAASGMVMTENPLADMTKMPGMAAISGTEHGPSCLVAPSAPNSISSSNYLDPQGHKMSGHWVVPPGRQVNHSDVTWFMGLPFDTKLHYAVAHLHPFAESLTLRDLTTGQVVWEAKAEAPKKGIGLARVDTLTSREGIPLYKNHQYEMVSVYNNPLKVNVDSMASMFFALEDPEFKRPAQADLEARAEEAMDQSTGLILRTTAGDIACTLYRDQAPNTVKQIARLVRAGVYNNVHIGRVADNAMVVEAKLTPEQQKLTGLLPIETAKSDSGELSLCPGDASYTILLRADPSRDGRCTSFGRVGPGAGVLVSIQKVPRDANGKPLVDIEILKTELYDPAEQTSLTLAPAKPVAVK